MFRTFVFTALAFVVCSFAILAEEYKEATITKWEDGKTITVKVGDKEMTFKINADTKVLGGKDAVKDGFKTLEKRINDKGVKATITTTGKGDKETVTEVKVVGKKKN